MPEIVHHLDGMCFVSERQKSPLRCAPCCQRRRGPPRYHPDWWPFKRRVDL